MNAPASRPVLLWVLLISVVLTVGFSFYKYVYTQDYTYLVEASCDPATQQCYERDCTNPDDCPPNGLADYRVFELPATEFKYCSDNSCANICPSDAHRCVEDTCDSQSDVACVGPNP